MNTAPGVITLASVATSHTQPGLTTVGRAYGGPAHGQTWPVDDDNPPEALESVSGGCTYRLIHHPRTHLPARDHLGNYLYMPVSSRADGHNPLRGPLVGATASST
ncbi:hypothetical protein ACGFIF_17185 [Kribbella sp. NPDC049174]|uniref:hypothetical protein n=1 Tax=Kribbella sp. NPDC049174 TaxID=3364112 RepID=UPI00371A3826